MKKSLILDLVNKYFNEFFNHSTLINLKLISFKLIK